MAAVVKHPDVWIDDIDLEGTPEQIIDNVLQALKDGGVPREEWSEFCEAVQPATARAADPIDLPFALAVIAQWVTKI